MKKFFPILLLLCVIVSCDLPKTEYSKELSEPAIVCETVYTPATHGDAFGPTISLSGKIGFASVDVDTEETFAVVFKCQHGKFIVKRRDIWKKVKDGDKVIVKYKEVYNIVEGKTPVLVDYDFIDAVPDLGVVPEIEESDASENN